MYETVHRFTRTPEACKPLAAPKAARVQGSPFRVRLTANRRTAEFRRSNPPAADKCRRVESLRFILLNKRIGALI